MKDLKEYLYETEEKVYVVKDDEGEILNVFDNEKDAKDDAASWNKEDETNKMEVSEEPMKEYIK